MVLLCGIPGDGPFELVGDALDSIGQAYVVLNQRRFADISANYSLVGAQLEGELSIGSEIYRLEDFTGIYNRAAGYQTMPEYVALRPDAPLAQHCAGLHEVLSAWFDITPARVLNRNFFMSSNASKPYQQLKISQCGFLVPPTLITNSPQEVLDFKAQYGSLIFKSASGIRSIVRELNGDDEQRLDQIRACPAMFQQRLTGINYRVHVVGERLFPTKINSGSVDYRYGLKMDGKAAELEPCELPDDVAAKCLLLSRELGLPLAGIDLFCDLEGQWHCFEVNPSPGFSYFENNTEQPISTAIAEYLSAN
jgi:glutathione synthase/RimK-type ligase-like ATP-grasp enzyme